MTLNGAHFATAGSKTVSVPPVTTTATGEPWVCHPKLPPGWIVIESRTTAPVVAWMVVAFIIPTASGFATIGSPPPNDGAAIASAPTTAKPSSLMFMTLLLSDVHFTVRRRRLGGASLRLLCAAFARLSVRSAER